jgi:glycosyltransferase involved in cell wall biosynthesis
MLLKLLNIKYIYYPFGQLMPLAMKKKGKVIKKTFYLYVFLKPMLKRAWRIHANSIYEKKVITELIGVTKFIIAPLSIEGYELNKLEKVDQKKYYTYIGRLDIWHKGLDIMLEAILMNVESFHEYNIKVIIAGRGEPQEVEMIQELINDFELNNVVILKSNITESEKTEILNQSLFFIHPSRVEGFARSMREAIYLEIPIITTYDSNIGDYIEDYNCGFSSNFDVISLSKSIQKSFSCINNISVYDFKLLKKKLTWKNTTNLILQEFENLR